MRLVGGTDGRIMPSWGLWPLAGSSCSAVTFPERSGRTVGGVDQAQPAPGHGPAGPEVTARRFRAASPALAWVLGGAVLVLAVAAVLLTALIGQLSMGIPAGVVVVLTFAAVGLLIARRQPGNPIGWIPAPPHHQAGARRHRPVPLQEPYELPCGAALARAILDKSPNHPADSVCRLVIEATFAP